MTRQYEYFERIHLYTSIFLLYIRAGPFEILIHLFQLYSECTTNNELS